MKNSAALAVTVLCVLLVAQVAGGEATDENKSLEKCQKTAGKEVGKYGAAYQKTVAGCLDKIAKERIKEAEPNAAGAAKPCTGKLRKLVNSTYPHKTLAAKADTKIKKFCDPDFPTPVDAKAKHSIADVIGAGVGTITVTGDTINATQLGDWCQSFGGDGSVGSIQEWIDCQLAAATCEGRQQMVAEYPNLLVWLEDLRGALVALDDVGTCGSPCGDCADPKLKDACNALDALDLALDADSDNAADIQCGPSALVCGNGTLEGAEECEFGDLNGETCSSQGFFGGALACTPGSCTFDTTGCASCSSAGGGSVGGSCWFLGSNGESCDTVCGNLTLDYDTATQTYAGSGGSDGNCEAVLDALGAPGTTVTGAGCGVGVGCMYDNGGSGRIRCTDTTTSSASFVTGQRACACQPTGP